MQYRISQFLNEYMTYNDENPELWGEEAIRFGLYYLISERVFTPDEMIEDMRRFAIILTRERLENYILGGEFNRWRKITGPNR